MSNRYWCVLALALAACGEVAAGDWEDLTNIPPGFADGTDDVGQGPGFAGTGSADTAARSDHTHAWDDVQNKPSGFADGVDNIGPETWVKLGTATRTDSTTFSLMGLDGNAYRRFRIEVEGVVSVAGADRVITIRPNGATTGYGPTSMHWGGHSPGVTYDHSVSNTGNFTNAIPICVTHYNQDGHVMCTSEMNSKSGRFRLVLSETIFATALTSCGTSGTGCIIQDSITGVWRDTATNITSLEFGFPSITVFNGDITLWGLR